jgi:predicted PurR-regulated permease PerM
MGRYPARMPSSLRTPRSAHVTFGILLIGSVLLLGAVMLPVWKPLFMAAVLAAWLSPVNEWLGRKLKGRRRIATTITTFLVVVILLIPLVTLGFVIVGEAVDAFTFLRDTLAQGGVTGLIERLVERLPDIIQQPIQEVLELIPLEQSLSEHAMTGGRAAAELLTSVLSGAGKLALDTVLMLVALHVLLLRGQVLVAWIEQISPLPETGELLAESRRVSKFAIRSSFATALLQGVVATIGFAIASVPNPFFFGTLAFFAAFIPSVGTALVTFPMIGLLVLSGYVWQPIFLTIWSVIAIGLIDNLVHPLLIRGGAHLNGVAILFALIGGLIMFGGIGLIIGPLALALFLAMIRFAYRDYVDEPPRVLTPFSAAASTAIVTPSGSPPTTD